MEPGQQVAEGRLGRDADQHPRDPRRREQPRAERSTWGNVNSIAPRATTITTAAQTRRTSAIWVLIRRARRLAAPFDEHQPFQHDVRHRIGRLDDEPGHTEDQRERGQVPGPVLRVRRDQATVIDGGGRGECRGDEPGPGAAPDQRPGEGPIVRRSTASAGYVAPARPR